MPNVPPLEDPTTVKKMVETLKKLTTERLDIEKEVVNIQYLLQDHDSNFSILHDIIVADPKAVRFLSLGFMFSLLTRMLILFS